jgi:Helix-turn-helix domain/DnaA N-terminal domain
MSWQACYYAKKLRAAPNGERITAYEKLVLLHLADAHNEERGIAWPSEPTIAEDCAVCLRQVQNLLHSLERKGVIRILRPEKNGRGRCLRYRFPELDAQAEKGAPNSPLVSQRRKMQERRIERLGNTQERRNIDAQNSSVIRKEQGTTNSGTEKLFDLEQIPEGLDQGRSNQVWRSILDSLKASVDPHEFDIWLAPLKSIGCANGVLWIRLPKTEFREMVERYTDRIQEAITANEIHDITTVRFA